MELVTSLYRVAGSRRNAGALLEAVASDAGVTPDFSDRTLVALALCAGGRTPEEVAASLTWREFESFCSKLMMAAGYRVEENVMLRKPRAQIDVVAFGPSLVLSVDCKHWKRGHSPAGLGVAARKQVGRSERLRIRLPDSKPIASVILSFSEVAGSFVEGAAVVPVRSLRSFLTSVESYAELMELR